MARRPGDFTEATKALLAARAGYQCSHPTCSVTTVGPGASGGVNKNGEAAHIFPASPKGPRSQHLPGSSIDVNDISNGIWLCTDHAKLIDQRRGVDFPPFVLKAWKKLHETRLALGQGTPAIRYGWLHALEVFSCSFMPTTTLEFGPATVISGPNGSGKTQLLKLLTSMQAEGFSAWTARGGIECELQWFDPNLQTMRIIVPNDRTPLFRIDGRDFGIRPSAPTTITLSKIETMRDPVATAINSLGLGGKDLQRLVPLLGRRSGTGFAGSAVDRVELDEHNELSAYGEKTWKQGLPFGSLSGGEQAALLVELAIIRAQHIHGTGPILLAIDPWPTITQQFGPKLGVLLTELTSSVQVFVTSSTELNFDTTGWAKSVLSIRWR